MYTEIIGNRKRRMKMKRHLRVGRPTLSKAKRRKIRLTVFLNAAEKRALESSAKAAGFSVPIFIRDAIAQRESK